MTPTQIIFTIALVIYLIVISYRWFVYAFIFDSDIDGDTAWLSFLWWALLIIYSQCF